MEKKINPHTTTNEVTRGESSRSFGVGVKICFFGIYDSKYSRNRVLMRGLRENGVEIIECNSRLIGVKKYFDLIKKHRKISGEYDVMLVAFPGYQAMILAKFLIRKPIIFDSFFSIYNSAVEDRKTRRKFSLRGVYYWFLDWLSCTLANDVLLDTEANIDYFVKKFRIKKGKFIRVFVGTDSSIFYPREVVKNEKFLVHFHGTFIPLQGTEYIIKAVDLLRDEDIEFQVIGTGQEYCRVRKIADNLGLKNINWIDRVDYEELPRHISKADACLGIFGDTSKADLVIPNKVFEDLACRRPIITASTRAIKELLTDRENVILCNRADSSDLAKKILLIKNDESLRSIVAQAGYELFRNSLLETDTTKHIISKHESR